MRAIGKISSRAQAIHIKRISLLTGCSLDMTFRAVSGYPTHKQFNSTDEQKISAGC